MRKAQAHKSERNHSHAVIAFHKRHFYRFLPTIKSICTKLKMKSEMDIVEIVTTIAHKIWNCKHFSSLNMFDKRKMNQAKTILFPFLMRSFYFHLLFTCVCVFLFLFSLKLQTAPIVDAFIWIFTFASGQSTPPIRFAIWRHHMLGCNVQGQFKRRRKTQA